MADILTLAQARSALGWKDGQNPDRDAELSDLYIPATTRTVESWCGRMADRVEVWETDKASPIATPWPAATIKSVTSCDRTLTGWTFTAGVLTLPGLSDGQRVRVVATDLPTPPTVILAARIILAQLWNADKQGAASTQVRSEPVEVPAGFAVPRRAEALLAPFWLGPRP